MCIFMEALAAARTLILGANFVPFRPNFFPFFARFVRSNSKLSHLRNMQPNTRLLSGVIRHTEIRSKIMDAAKSKQAILD